MSQTKRTKRSRRSTNPDKSATTDVVTQLEVAVRRPQATLIGALVGGIVPWFARTLAHDQLPAAWSSGRAALGAVMLAVVLGCACFSAITVYKFGRATFGDKRKALGFVLAIEGVMLVSTGATSNVALAVLILINALANGSAIALARDATCKRREVAARSAATRARTRERAQRPTAASPLRSPMEVVESAPKKPRTARTTARAMVPSPKRWSPVDDVIDAVIVSEERFAS
jgi:hypothetical protein